MLIYGTERGDSMNPCQISAIITAVSNHLYANLSQEDFEVLNIMVSELSKSMLSMTLLRGVCEIDRKHGGK